MNRQTASGSTSRNNNSIVASTVLHSNTGEENSGPTNPAHSRTQYRNLLSDHTVRTEVGA